MDSPSASSPTSLPPSPRATLLRRGLSALLLAGAIALGAHTLVSAGWSDPVHSPETNLPPIADPAEAVARQSEIAGTYATGNRPGDRVIVVHADGRVQFSELGAKDPVNEDTDTYQLRRRGKKFALVTTRSGVIDIVDIDNVSYWRDSYRRR